MILVAEECVVFFVIIFFRILFLVILKKEKQLSFNHDEIMAGTAK
jgi:hypothetical protein